MKAAERVGLANEVDHLLTSAGRHECCDPEKTLLIKEARRTVAAAYSALEPEEILSFYMNA